MTDAEGSNTKPLRILIVSQYFWPENFHINHIARALQARGHTVTVLTGKPNYPAGSFFDGYSMFGNDDEQIEGVRITRVPLISRGASGGVRLIANYVSFVIGARLFGFRKLDGPYDVIFAYQVSPITVGMPAIGAKRKFKAPILFWVLDLWPESISAAGKINNSWILAAVTRLVRYIYRSSDRVLIQSEAFRPRVEAKGTPPEKIVYFPQSTTSMFQPLSASDAPEEKVLMPSGFKLMFAGNIGHAQDFDTVIEAAEMLRDVPKIQWVVLGDGRRRKWLEQEVIRRDLSDRFHMLGAHPEDSMPRFFAHADAMLVTLRRDPIFSLTVPAKIQSYLACGKPIIAGLDGEGARIVEDAGAGIAAPAGNAKELSQAVRKMYELTKTDREEMGANALAYSQKHFGPESQIDHLVRLMRSAASSQ